VVCDTALNYIRNDTTLECECNAGYLENTQNSTYFCYDVCGDGITAVGYCDDGNRDPGDGCDENCTVEDGFHCTTTYNSTGDPSISKCVLITSVSVTFLYA
jgi:cysteine-rich repeat protein